MITALMAPALTSEGKEADALSVQHDRATRELAAVRHKIAELLQARSSVGAIPPGPPTARARFGAFLIGRVKRSLFWLLPQLDRFHATLIEILRQQTGLAEALLAAQHEQAAFTTELATTWRRHVQHAESRRLAEMERAAREMRQALREVEDRARELEHRMKSEEDRLTFQMEQLRNEAAARMSSTSVFSNSDEKPRRAEGGSVPEDVLHVLREFGPTAAPVLDIGSGDEAWLESLAAAGLSASAVERSHVASTAAAKGLRIVSADPFTYLASLPSCSMGTVTASSWAELTLPRLTMLFDEVMRILKPGGIAILIGPVENPSAYPWFGGVVDQLAHWRGFDGIRVTTFRSGQDALIARKPSVTSDNIRQP